MEIKENILLAIESIKANKTRALLTMLGIIIGISSVIGVLSIGDALSSNVSTQYESMGAGNIYVMVTKKSTEYEMSDEMEESVEMPPNDELLTKDQIRNFEDSFQNDIQAISYSYTVGSGKAKNGRLYANVNMIGVSEGYKKTTNINVLKGRFIEGKDTEAYKNVAVISDDFAKKMFGNQDPLMKEIKVNKSEGVYVFTVVGVYKHQENGMSGGGKVSEKDRRTDLFIPVTVAEQIINTYNYDGFTVMGQKGANVTELTDKIKHYFEKNYRSKEYQVTAMNMEKEMESMTKMMSLLKLAVAVIAGISLIVGGIGVMNIMLVSVTERTREIGTRKALGAKKFQIKTQFVFESAIISLVGGIIGIIIGLMLSLIVTLVLKSPFTINFGAIACCTLFSGGIGIFFGYYPANKAASLDPIDALRYE